MNMKWIVVAALAITASGCATGGELNGSWALAVGRDRDCRTVVHVASTDQMQSRTVWHGQNCEADATSPAKAVDGEVADWLSITPQAPVSSPRNYVEHPVPALRLHSLAAVTAERGHSMPKYSKRQRVIVKVSGAIGLVTGIIDNDMSTPHYNVLHLNAAGDRTITPLPEYEIDAALPDMALPFPDPFSETSASQ